MDVRLRHPALRQEFESYMHKVAPEFFIPGLPPRLRQIALRRALGVPSSVMTTPQERLLATIAMPAGGGTTRNYSPEIPRSLYPYWNLRLSGTITKTEAVAGTLVGEQPLTAITGFRLLQDGALFKDIDLPHLRVISQHIYRGVDTALTGITLGNDTAEAFSARVPLDFRTMRSENPNATLWPADRYGQLTLEVDWAASSATTIPGFVSGGTYSAISFPTNPTLQIWGQEIVDPKIRGGRYWLQRYSQKVQSVSSTAMTEDPFTLPIGEIIRGIVVSQYTNSPRVPISTLVAANNKIKIRLNGQYYKYETTWQELIDKNLADYGIALPTGYAFIDWMNPDNGGLYDAAFRADQGASALEALVDVSSVANAFLQFTLITFAPARNFR